MLTGQVETQMKTIGKHKSPLIESLLIIHLINDVIFHLHAIVKDATEGQLMLVGIAYVNAIVTTKMTGLVNRTNTMISLE